MSRPFRAPILALAALLGGGLATDAAAQQSVTMTYQGSLSDLAGAPIEGTRAVTFRLFTEPEGGEPLWVERHEILDVVAGQFTAVLGAREPFGAELDGGQALYLSVQVEGDDPFEPRMPVGGALRAQWARRAVQADDVEGRHIHPAQVTIGDVAVIDDQGRWVGPRDGFGGAGPEGPAGPQGPRGEGGPPGVQGQAGPAGSQGDPGAAGAAGAQGEAGPVGRQGEAGPQGPQGAAGVAGAQGDRGLLGPQGERGLSGEDGAAGPMGAAGPVGAAPDHEWSGTQLRLSGLDGAWGDWAELGGPAGPAGPVGGAGPEGPAGIRGPAGAQGAGGVAGPQGAAGPAGEQGLQGVAGPAGSQGPAGARGPLGAQGAQGLRGLPADPMDFVLDTDNDGFADWIEVAAGTDYNDVNAQPADTNVDGIADFFGGQPGGAVGLDGRSLRRFKSIAQGTNASCGVQLDGGAICWGQGYRGEATPPDGTFLTVSLYDEFTCALRADGEAVCWGGLNAAAHVDPPAGPYVLVEAGDDFGCGIRQLDGTLTCWGNTPPDTPPGAYIGLALARNHGCAIADDNTVACWGSDVSGQASPPAGVQFSEISITSTVGCGVRLDTGTFRCWGDPNSGVRRSTPGGTGVGLTLAWGNGTEWGCGWRADGTVRCWGTSLPGGFPDRPVSSLEAGNKGICAIYANDSTAYCWGRNNENQADIPL